MGLTRSAQASSRISLRNRFLGRTLRPGDERTRRPVVVLSERLWRRRFAADPGVIGKTITLDAQDYTVIGVYARNVLVPASVRSGRAVGACKGRGDVAKTSLPREIFSSQDQLTLAPRP